jgi:type VI secretion system protein ImpA
MNINSIMNPLPGISPCGEDLSFSAEFDFIAEMRREDDPTLDQGAWVTSLKSADWRGVEAECIQLLTKRSKDLRIAMWLTESASVNRGYPGMDEGLQVCTQLCEQYWADLYPLIEDNDIEERVGNLTWLINRVAVLANRAPVTTGASGRFSLADMQAAKTLQASLGSPDKPLAAAPEGALTLEKFNRALKETPKEDMLATIESIKSCQNSLNAWQAVIDAHLGREGPSFVPSREALAEALHSTLRLARDAGFIASATPPGPETSGNADNDSSDTQKTHAQANALGHGPVRSRQQALMQLREVAVFFRATEPHSPVAYLADKAAQWGEMALHDWLREVVKDSGALKQLEELLGSAQNGAAPS